MTIGTATELWRMSAMELAEAVRTKQASSREVVEAHLRRIEAVNPAVNAVVLVLADEALDAATTADRQLASRAELPPFHGVPFTVKENIDVAGTATTQGLRALAAAFPAHDAPAVERLRAAGGIVLGRTNMPSAAVRWHCESELWGATVNPWDAARTPGASSAGEAAAIATGMSPLGLGNDGLGSLRHPAQCCGIAALKPTLGRIPQDGSVGPGDAAPIAIQLTSVTGPLARRVADLAAAFAVLAGPTWRDPWTVPAPVRGPATEAPARVAVVVDPDGGIAPQVRDGVRKAADALADAGYVVEPVEPPGIDVAGQALVTMLSAPALRAFFEQIALPTAPEPMRRFMAGFFAAAGNPDDLAVEQAFVTRRRVLRAWAELQETHPLLLAPIATDIPAIAGTDLAEGAVAATLHAMRFATAVNLLGLPAVALPVGIGGGLPQAVQLIGPRYREDLCLQAAADVEARVGIIAPIDPVAAGRPAGSR